MTWSRDVVNRLSQALSGDTSLRRALAGDDRLSAPPWVIAILGATVVVLGLAYFVLRARRSLGVPTRAPKPPGPTH
jgi:hypothetical protein